MPYLDDLFKKNVREKAVEQQVLRAVCVRQSGKVWARVDGSRALWGPLENGGTTPHGANICIVVDQTGKSWIVSGGSGTGGGGDINADAIANTLPVGSPATADVTEDPANLFHFAFGIPAGDIGPKGDKGDKGDIGNQGIQGIPGINGANGAPGSKWFSGSGAPGGGLGIIGDWYLNDTNGDVYEKTGAALWALRDNLTGPVGAASTVPGPPGPPGAVANPNYVKAFNLNAAAQVGPGNGIAWTYDILNSCYLDLAPGTYRIDYAANMSGNVEDYAWVGLWNETTGTLVPNSMENIVTIPAYNSTGATHRWTKGGIVLTVAVATRFRIRIAPNGGSTQTILTATATHPTAFMSAYLVGAGTQGPVGPATYDTAPLGSAISWTRKTIPGEYVLANGQRLTRAAYPDAYDLAVVEVAAGNPLWTVRATDATFTVPDFSNKFLYSGALANMGAAGGETFHLLTTAESGQKAVTSNAADRNLDHLHQGPSNIGAFFTTGGGDGAGLVAPSNGYDKYTRTGWMDRSIDHLHTITGSDATTAHNNMPPYVTVGIIVKVKGATISSGAIVGPAGPAGNSLPPADLGKVVAVLSADIGASAGITTATGVETELFASVAGDFRMVVTPTVNCWWETSYRVIFSLAADYGWIRNDAVIKLQHGGVALGGELVDARGMYQFREVNPHHLSLGWCQTRPYMAWKLQAGKTYTFGIFLSPQSAFTYNYYKHSTHMSGHGKVIGYW